MEPEISPAAGLLVLMSLALFVGLAITLALRSVAAARVGTPLHRGRPRGPWRVLCFAGLAILATLALVVPGAPSVTGLAVLALSGLLVLLTPAPGDTVVGSDGVQAGWHAARFVDLEEWRLTGDHLRWSLRGEWLASEAPVAHHPALRGLLESLAPDRESRFKA